MSSRMSFPGGPNSIPVDERIVMPESRAEIIEGVLHFVPPAHEPHAVPHADLAYVLRAHVKAGYSVAVDMLTRTSETNDFAPDASVYLEARDPDTGGRRLEELAFEIVSEQPLSTQTTKARQLTARGVRRIFCLVVKRAKLLEWSHETDGWSATSVDSIVDESLVRPLPAGALLDAAAADKAVVRALLDKGDPEVLAIRNEALLEGRAEGLRVAIAAIADVCSLLGIELTPEHHAALSEMSANELDELRLRITQDRAWPHAR